MESSKVITGNLVFIKRTWKLHKLLNSQEFMLLFRGHTLDFQHPYQTVSNLLPQCQMIWYFLLASSGTFSNEHMHPHTHTIINKTNVRNPVCTHVHIFFWLRSKKGNGI